MTPITNTSNPCSCGSQAPLENCCLPFIRGKKQPATAEELLRARYTAFTIGEIDYIVETHHSKTRHEIKREEVEQWAKNSEWLGLEIFQREGGSATDDKGTLVFCARYKEHKKDQKVEEVKISEHWEQSIFEKEQGQWRFLDARAVKQGTYVREQPKTGRNDPCPCGSNKKFKKCCGSK